MNSLPYAFCDSVAALLSDHSANVIGDLNSSNPQFRMWASAVTENTAKREDFIVYFNNFNYVHIYEIRSGDRRFTFGEFKRMNKQHVRVSRVEIGGWHLAAFRSPVHEIHEIATFTARFVNMATLNFTNRFDKEELLGDLPWFYQDCSFSQISFTNKGHNSYNDFLLSQLESKWLRNMHLLDIAGTFRWEAAELAGIEEPCGEFEVTDGETVFKYQSCCE